MKIRQGSSLRLLSGYLRDVHFLGASREIGPREEFKASPIIYVAGSGHSGSTVLAGLLGTLPSLVAIGEFDRFPRRYPDHRCSCGAPIQACNFWSPLIPPEFSARPSKQNFQLVRESLLNSMASGTALVDSSKRLGSLRAWTSIGAMPYVIWLVRHPNAVAESAIRSVSRKTGGVVLSSKAAFMRWIGEQWRILRHLEQHQLPFTVIRFEEFISSPLDVLRLFDNQPSRKFRPVVPYVDFASQHHVAGNRLIREGVVSIRQEESHQSLRGVKVPALLPIPYRLKLYALLKILGYR